jgi:hypothetical protein
MMGLRAILATLVLMALVLNSSPGLAGELCPGCPADRCAPYAADCAAGDRGCISACDSTCSACRYVHTCVIEPLRDTPRVSYRFSWDPPPHQSSLALLSPPSAWTYTHALSRAQ